MTESRPEGRVGAIVVSLAAERVTLRLRWPLTTRRGNNFCCDFIVLWRKAGATFVQLILPRKHMSLGNFYNSAFQLNTKHPNIIMAYVQIDVVQRIA